MTRLHLPQRWGIDTNDYLHDLDLPLRASYAGRYIRTDGWIDPRTDHSPLMTHAEAEWCADVGLDLVTFHENGKSGEVLTGESAGRQIAIEATAIQDDLGGGGQAIFPTVDFSPLPGQLPTIGAHWKGWRSWVGVSRLGVYGPLSVLRYLFAEGLVTYGIQSTLGDWSDIVHPRATAVQYLNTDRPGNTAPDFGARGYLCYQRTRACDFGQWRPRL